MRDYGFLEVMFSRGEARLSDRFFHRSATDEAYAEGYAPVILMDFVDPLKLYGFMLLTSGGVLGVEFISSKVL